MTKNTKQSDLAHPWADKFSDRILRRKVTKQIDQLDHFFSVEDDKVKGANYPDFIRR